ncbi:MAG: helix-turn-helix domain-containing protein [Gemmatimonadaceae bacterium]
MPLHSVTAPEPGPVVLALITGRLERLRIATAVRGHATVQFAGTAGELLAHLADLSAPPIAAIVEPRDCDGRPTAGVVRQLAAAQPRLPIIGYCRAGYEHSRDIIELGVAGAHELLFHGIDDSGVALRGILTSAGQACAAAQVLQAIADDVPAALLPLFEFCLAYPERATSVQAVAHVLGVHRKTLVNYCAQASLPPPGAVIAWCRLLLVGHFLETPGRTVEGIALRVEFASATALRNMLRRYTGLRPQQVRERGGLRCIVDAFRRSLAERRERAADGEGYALKAGA